MIVLGCLSFDNSECELLKLYRQVDANDADGPLDEAEIHMRLAEALGAVPEGLAEALADALRDLLGDEEQLARMRQQCVESAGDLSWERIADRYAEVFEAAV